MSIRVFNRCTDCGQEKSNFVGDICVDCFAKQEPITNLVTDAESAVVERLALSVEPSQPNDSQIEALIEFADANGRTWKSALRDCWQTGRYPRYSGTQKANLLQQVRNSFGPSWLSTFSLKAAKEHYERTYPEIVDGLNGPANAVSSVDPEWYTSVYGCLEAYRGKAITAEQAVTRISEILEPSREAIKRLGRLANQMHNTQTPQPSGQAKAWAAELQDTVEPIRQIVGFPR